MVGRERGVGVGERCGRILEGTAAMADDLHGSRVLQTFVGIDEGYVLLSFQRNHIAND